MPSNDSSNDLKGGIMNQNRWAKTALILLALLISAYMSVDFAQQTEPVRSNRTDWLTAKLIAHKGLHSDKIPENTMAAFNEAITRGYPIELDVSMTKDKQIVVFHDKKLKRLFGVDGYLIDKTYQQVVELKFPGSTERIPLFSEVLNLVDGKVPLLIEIKNEGEVGEMESLVYKELKNYNGQYAVQSFNPYSVKWFRNNAPGVLRGQLSGSFIISDYEAEYAGTTRLPCYKRVLLSNMLLNFQSRPNFIAYELEYADSNTFLKLKKLGVPVVGWTVKDRAMYRKMKNDCDNFIVDTFDLQTKEQ